MRFHTQTAGVSLHRPAAADQHRAHRASRRWRRCSAAPSRCTPTRSTRRWRCPPRRRRRLALRTQQVIAARDRRRPTRPTRWAGRGCVESMTDELERQAYDYFDRIERLGGVVAALETELLPARDRRGQLPLPAGGRAQASGASSASTRTRRATRPIEILQDPDRGRGAAGRPRWAGARPAAATPRCERALAGLARRRRGRRERDGAPASSAPAPTPARARSATPCGRCGACTARRRSSRAGLSGSIRRMDAFEAVRVWSAERGRLGRAYLEFLRRDSMSLGLYTLRRPAPTIRRRRMTRTRPTWSIAGRGRDHGGRRERGGRPGLGRVRRQERSSTGSTRSASRARDPGRVRARRRAVRDAPGCARRRGRAGTLALDEPQDPSGGGEAGPRRPRSRRQDHRPHAARRRHGGDLHGAPPDARADRRDRDPGGCRRCRHLDPVRRAHDAGAAHPRPAGRERRRRRAGRRRRHDPRPTTSPS